MDTKVFLSEKKLCVLCGDVNPLWRREASSKLAVASRPYCFDFFAAASSASFSRAPRRMLPSA
jgi:hypothetical protein